MGLKLITSKSITRTNFDTKISWFGLAGSAMVVILDFLMFISQQFEELEGQDLEFLQNPPNIFMGPFWNHVGHL